MSGLAPRACPAAPLARQPEQLGDQFELRGFMEQLDAAGMIPISPVSWELAGKPPAFAAPQRCPAAPRSREQ